MSRTSPTAVDGDRVRWRAKVLAVCALLAALMAKQAPGRIIADTKLDLTEDPWGFLGRALHLWDPSAFFGQVQNQAYGYLFPMGPFFGLGHTLGVPAWVTQRLWLSLLVCAAFIGMVRLTGLLGVRSEVARIVAGLAYALTPRLLTGLGPTSVEILPMCLAPWVLVPLVAGSRGGDERRAALRSALVVLLMGGVNAVATAAALPPAVLWLLTRAAGPRRTRLLAWWTGGVLLATAWWAVPLVLLGRYSPDFLAFIESAAVTTGPTSLVEVLRGTSAWLAYVTGPYGPALPGGWSLLTNPVVVLDTVVVSAFGLAAMTWRGTGERRWLGLCLFVGTALVTAGHVGAVDSPWSEEVRSLLDGALAPLRNVHKFDLVLRLPLVVAGAFLFERLLVVAASSTGRQRDLSRARRAVVLLTATTALVGVSLPVLNFTLPAPAPYSSLPGYWRDTATFLGRHEGTALLVPGSSFGDYYWGSTRDEPLQALASRPWVVRDAVPLTTAGGIRYLDAVDRALSAGRPSDGLAPYLARAGVRYLVVRNDLEYGRAASERPLLLHETVVGSPGLTLVRQFGPVVGGGNAPGRYVDEGLDVPYRAVQVFEVDDWTGRAALAPLDATAVVGGGPESLLALAGRGLLSDQPVVLAADVAALPARRRHPTVLTDGLRRREVFFGRASDNTSQTLTRHEPRSGTGAATDYLEAGWEDHLTVARAMGVRALHASSSASDAAALGGARQDHNPWAAFDGDSRTSWMSDPGEDGPASWTVTFRRPREVGVVRLRTADQAPKDVVVSTDRSSVRHRVQPGRWVAIAAPKGASRSLTVSADPGERFTSFGLAEVRLAGIHAHRTMLLADGSADNVPSVLVDAGSQRPGCYPLVGTWLCSRSVARGAEEFGSLDRTVLLGAGGYDVSVTAIPRSGVALDDWLDRDAVARVTASSRADGGPAGRPGAVADGDVGTSWRAAPGDHEPWLRVRWSRAIRLERLQLDRAGSLAASYPATVAVTAGGRTQVVDVGRQGRVAIDPVTTHDLILRVTDVVLAGTFDPFTRDSDLLPVGLSELRWEAARVPDSDDLVVPCGGGPRVVVAGQEVRTRTSVSREELLGGRPVELSPCSGGDGAGIRASAGAGQVAVAPGRGPVRIRAVHSPVWDVDTVTLTPVGGPDGSPAMPGSAAPVSIISTGHGNDVSLRLPERSATSVLWLHQSSNSGWVAELGGRTLRPVRLDGWQQGFLVPGGQAASVELRYAPDRPYRWGLLAGAGAVVMLVAAACRRGTPGPSRAATAEGGLARASVPVGLVVLVLAFGWLVVPVVGVLAGAAALAQRSGRGDLAARALVLVAGSGFAAAGIALATRPWPDQDYSAGAAWSQGLCLLSLGAVWSALALEYIGTRDRRRMTGRSSTR